MKTQRDMITELYQKVVGIPENPMDNGLIGDVAEIRKQVTITNGTVRSNISRILRVEEKVGAVENIVETLRDSARPIKFTKNQIIGGSSGIITFLGLLIVAVGKTLGWW